MIARAENPRSAFAEGRSLGNLAASIALRFGAATPLAPLADPRLAQALAEARTVVLLVLDGLGSRQIESLIPGGALSQSAAAALRSVFPSSTAPALTTLATALPPASHANPGWFLWSERAGAVIRSLPMDLRAVPGSAVAAEETWSWVSLSSRLPVPSFAIQPHFIADSAFSRHAWAGSSRVGYRTLDEFADRVAEAAGALRGGGYVYAYVPAFDSTSHERGWRSDEAAAVARALDRVFERLAARLRDGGSLLLATADHGFIDVPADRRLRLEDFPEVARWLGRPLTGEPRVAYCHARDGCADAFAEAARRELGFAFDVFDSARLVADGWFGEGAAAELAGRVGSHTLVAREDWTLADTLPGEAAPDFVGMHGGTSDDEMRVTLSAAWKGAPL